MTRRGKIARLPHPIRDQINQRLQNGEEGKHIAEWINTLPEVRSLMAAEFDSQPVSEANLSKWKLGGYRDWEEQKAALQAALLFHREAAQLSQAGGPQFADQLALFCSNPITPSLHPMPWEPICKLAIYFQDHDLLVSGNARSARKPILPHPRPAQDGRTRQERFPIPALVGVTAFPRKESIP